MAKNWYVIQVYSGYEKTVKSQIEIKTILEKMFYQRTKTIENKSVNLFC